MKLRTCTWPLALLLVLPLGLTGCKDDTVGEKLDEVGNDVKREVEDAAD